MMPNFARRPAAIGVAACCLVVVLGGCGDAVTTPFFDSVSESKPTGGTSGNTGGATTGGTDGGGSATGGSSAGDAGTAGTSAGTAGSSATGGTGSGGASGAPMGGTSGTDAGGSATTGGSGGSGTSVECAAADPAAVAYENHCYVLRSTPRTWAAARDDCAAHGAHLAVIGSDGRSEQEFEAENAFVWMLGSGAEVWIGATDGRPSNQAGNGMPYAWIDGESILYDRWSSGQPNNAQSSCMDNAPCSCGDACWEHCAFLWQGGEWNDRHCEHLIGYVCEWDAPPT